MAQIILVTGGARSGKSSHAQELAEKKSGSRVYVATCPVLFAGDGHDPEMADRIARHRDQRASRNWHTVEEPVDLARTLATLEQSVVLVDCLTLWVNNLLYGAASEFTEDDVARHVAELIVVCQKRSGTVLMVTNEVGWGVVPGNKEARRFRDLVGRCNQLVGAAADQVTLVVSGQPLTLKGA